MFIRRKPYELPSTGYPALDKPYANEHVYVPQGSGKKSKIQPLVTMHILQCSGVIIKNQTTSETIMLHLDQRSIESLSEPLNILCDDFFNMPGEKVGFFVEGKHSYCRQKIKALFQERGVRFSTEVIVPLEREKFSLVFYPENNVIQCYLETTQTIISYDICSNFNEICERSCAYVDLLQNSRP